jgi:hypothetical protein
MKVVHLDEREAWAIVRALDAAATVFESLEAAGYVTTDFHNRYRSLAAQVRQELSEPEGPA